MKYYVAGSNLFGQWSWDELLRNEFKPTIMQKKRVPNESKASKLVQVNWSYNILQIDGNFYISGALYGKENQLVKIPLPTEYEASDEELIVVGNDYNFILANKNSYTLWVGNLNMKKNLKQINLMTEQPISNEVKKQKRCNGICKVVLMNDSCLYLTSEGDVYCGILPSYVNITHCKGKVCDIQCGYEHYVLLTNSGYVYTWGNGRRFQHGHGDICTVEQPKEVEALSGIKISKVACGGWHSLALSEFGDIYAWGWNDMCQLGLKHDQGQHESCIVPTLIDLFDENGEEVRLNINDIACGSRHSTLLLEDNTVWTTGCNKYGQLGFPEEKYPTVRFFKKAFQCDNDSELMCGPWATVIINKR